MEPDPIRFDSFVGRFTLIAQVVPEVSNQLLPLESVEYVRNVFVRRWNQRLYPGVPKTFAKIF
jgi:hypothetical protein